MKLDIRPPSSAMDLDLVSDGLAFVTGSFAYGRPGRCSDIDVVVLVDPGVKEFLTNQSDSATTPVKYGNLNLILVQSIEMWRAWLNGTIELMALKEETGKPVPRPTAIDILTRHRKIVGSFDYGDKDDDD